METLPSKSLVFGFSDVGKTHYRLQLLNYLQNRKGLVKLRNFPSDISDFENEYRQIQSGMSADHTSENTYSELNLELSYDDGSDFDLILPDYGGEQLRKILELRRIPSNWKQRLLSSEQWLLFLRVPNLSTNQIPEKLAPPPDKTESNITMEWDENARYVELIQILLSASDRTLSSKLDSPRLCVVLSCWDELPEESLSAIPKDLLSKRLPMFSNFLQSNWLSDSYSIWGLSSLGKKLSKDEVDEDFVDLGPENQGYVIRPDGLKADDLTEPLDWLFNKKNETD